MKYFGYFLLFILFVYFVFIKPFLILHRIEFKLEGFEVNLKERRLEFKEFLLFIPKFRENTLFLRINNLAVHKSHLKAEEISFILVSSRVSKEPFDYDFTNLTKSLNKLNLSIDKAYVSINSVPDFESITVFVGKAHLENRKVWSKEPATAYYIHKGNFERIAVLLKEAYLSGPTLRVVSSEVVGKNYLFHLSASWRGKRGSFSSTGLIKKIDGGSFSIEPIRVKAEGYLDYTNIDAHLELQTDSLKIKEKEYRNLQGTGRYSYVWRKQNILSVNFDGTGIKGSLEYNLSRNAIKLYLNKLILDESLFSVNKNVRGIFSGSLFANIQEKTIKLEGNVHDLLVDSMPFKTASLNAELNYGYINKGKIDFISETLDLRGSFYGSDFTGKLSLKGLPYSDDRMSGVIFYEGSLSYLSGNLLSLGKGMVLDFSLQGRKLGNLSFNLSFRNPKYQIRAEGQGFYLEGEGSTADKTFTGRVSLTGFSFREKDTEFSDLKGIVSLQVSEQEFNINGRGEGRLKQENLELKTLWEFYLSGEKEQVRGKFIGDLNDIKYEDLEFKSGFLKGEIKHDNVVLNYTIDGKLKGLANISLKDKTFSTQGEWDGEIGGAFLKLSYNLQRATDGSVVGNLRGKGEIRGFLIPIEASLQLKGDKIKAIIREFRIQKGILTVDVGKVDLEDGKIHFLGASVSLNSEEVIKIPSSEGFFDLRERKFEVPDIKISGFAQGKAKIAYSPSSGFNMVSEGQLSLEKLSSLFKSKAQTLLAGNLYYYVDTKGKKLNIVLLSKEPIQLRSRYLGMPLVGTAYFSGDEQVFKGSISFGRNGYSFKAQIEGTQSQLTANFHLDRVPIIYRDESFRGNVLLKGKGTLLTDYKELKIASDLSFGGTVEIKSSSKQKQESKGEFVEKVILDMKISSYEPLRVYLPEGFIYSSLDGHIKGKLSDPDYKVKISLSSGELKYFNRKFYVKSGTYKFSKEEKEMDLLISASLPEYVVLIDLKGNPEYPKVALRSEPPKEPRQILADLILGGGEAQGIISLGDVLFSQILQRTGLTKDLEKTLGTELNISVSPYLSSSGEVGISAKVSKDITYRFSLEYQQSTSKNPKESFVGADAKIASSTSIGGRINSDRSKEVKLRMRGKFNF